MDTLIHDLREIDPTDPLAADLIAAHLEFTRASSPACSVHSLEAADLAGVGARFFVIVEDGRAVAMGAVKLYAPGQAELKSMHVLKNRRGGGRADAILQRCLDAARELGATSVSLETGSQDAFQAARAFYARHGFRPCAPFADYTDDPESAYMSRLI